MPSKDRVTFTLPPSIQTLLKQEAAHRGVRIADVIRDYLTAGLKSDGYEVPTDAVKHGGSRKR